MVAIHTATGGTYYARVSDVEEARAQGWRDVPLTTASGEPVIGAVGRGNLRLSTILAAEVRPLDPTMPSSPASIHDDMKPADEEMLKYFANAKREAHEATIAEETTQDCPSSSDKPEEVQDSQEMTRRGRGR